ncbi:MAG TPA: hypothetical protein VGF97_08990 [Rhizomicrobium sp.]|jgi:hypothetical protein
MKSQSICAASALAIMLSGCATVIQGSSQSIAVTTPPTTGAYCTLTSKEGNWTVLSPGVATVEKSKEDIVAHCSKAGWQDASATIPSDFQGWTIGNVLLGGLIGVGVDAATGAINQYPKAFAVPMQPMVGYAPSQLVQPQFAQGAVNDDRAGSAPLPDASGNNMQSFDHWQESNSTGKN